MLNVQLVKPISKLNADIISIKEKTPIKSVTRFSCILYNSYLIYFSIEFNVLNVFRLTENECHLWDTNSLSKQYEDHNWYSIFK
jgi:hypothetical protein